jgi:hypothetical protein
VLDEKEKKPFTNAQEESQQHGGEKKSRRQVSSGA